MPLRLTLEGALPGVITVFEEVGDDAWFMHKGGIVDQDIGRAKGINRRLE